MHEKGKSPVECTPLLQSTSRSTRPRSYASTLNSMPKRRHRVKLNWKTSRFLDKASSYSPPALYDCFEYGKVCKAVSHYSQPSATTLVGGSSVEGDSENAAWRSLNYVANSKTLESSADLSSCSTSPQLPLSISLTLQNSGSVARDHLASERTFLAYMRTSLAIASSGVALVQLFTSASALSPQEPGNIQRLHAYVRPLGASTVMLGLIVLVVGLIRYFTVQAALTKGYFPVARLLTGFIAFALAALVTVTFAIVLARRPRMFAEGMRM